MKLREGNVFRGFCLSTGKGCHPGEVLSRGCCKGGGGPWMGVCHEGEVPWRVAVKRGSMKRGAMKDSPLLVNKWAIRILLECFLQFLFHHLFIHPKGSTNWTANCHNFSTSLSPWLERLSTPVFSACSMCGFMAFPILPRSLIWLELAKR